MAVKKKSTKKETKEKGIIKNTKKAAALWAKRIRKFIFVNKVFFLSLFVVLLAGAVYYFRGYFIVATVNGHPISRYSVLRELESQGGDKILQGKITESLIRQEAKKRGIEVTNTEVVARISTIKSEFDEQGQDFDQILNMQGMSMDQFEKQIYIQLIIEKMFAEDAEISQEEVDKYIAENKDSLPLYENEEQKQTAVKDNLRQTKLVDSFQSWLQEAQGKAEIKYLFKY